MSQQPQTSPAAPTSRLELPLPMESSTIVFTAYRGTEIQDDILEKCANLFSTQYGVWGPRPEGVRGPKQGTRVKMTAPRLRQEMLVDPENTVLAACYLTSPQDPLRVPELVGHALGFSLGLSCWLALFLCLGLMTKVNGKVGWVSQLVVETSVRRQYIATQLLQTMKRSPVFANINAIGVVSSHPVICAIVAKVARQDIRNIDLEFCRVSAKSIIEASHIPYVQDMKLCGSLFQHEAPAGVCCSVFTDFYVDHREPLAALAVYRNRQQRWDLGELLDGYEFLVLLPSVLLKWPATSCQRFVFNHDTLLFAIFEEVWREQIRH